MLLEAQEVVEVAPTPETAELSDWLVWLGLFGAAVLLLVVGKKLGVRFERKKRQYMQLLCVLPFLGLMGCTNVAAKQGVHLVKELRAVNEQNYTFGDQGKPVPESAKNTERAAIDALEDHLKAIAGE